MNKIFMMTALAIFLFWGTGPARAEQVANLSGCDVCHGAVNLTREETLSLLGNPLFERFAKIRKNAVVKFDLDSILDPGNQASPDDGYEIRIWNIGDVVQIRDMRDKSTIQLAVSRDASGVSARIYLEASKENEIDLSDTVDFAWVKFRFSNIYHWVGNSKDKRLWLNQLKDKLYWSMALLSPA